MFIEHYFYNFQNLEAIHISFSKWMNKHLWCGVAQSCPPLHDHMDMEPTRLLCSWNSPGKDTGVCCHALPQGIFLTRGWNLHLLCFLHWQAGYLPLAPPGSPIEHLLCVKKRKMGHGTDFLKKKNTFHEYIQTVMLHEEGTPPLPPNLEAASSRKGPLLPLTSCLHSMLRKIKLWQATEYVFLPTPCSDLEAQQGK